MAWIFLAWALFCSAWALLVSPLDTMLKIDCLMWPGRPLPEDKEIRLVLQSLIVDNMCLFAVGRLAARFGIQTDVAKSLTPSSIKK